MVGNRERQVDHASERRRQIGGDALGLCRELHGSADLVAEEADHSFEDADEPHHRRLRRRQLGELLLELREPLRGAVDVARAEPRHRVEGAELGMLREGLVGQHREPPGDGAVLTAGEQDATVTLDQARRVLGVAAGDRVVDRLGNEPMLVEPGRGAPVERRRCRRVARSEAVTQQLREQRVVPVPPPLLVEPLHEEVVLGELIEHRVAAAAAGDRVAEVAGEPPQQRGREQELLHLRRQGAQHFVH